MIEVYTLLWTGSIRVDMFAWQHRASEAHPEDRCIRVDTWEIHNHEAPGGEVYTLYACTMVFEHTTRINAEARRGK